MALDRLSPAERILLAVRRRNHDRAAYAEDAEQIEDGQIELERRDPQHAVGAAEREALDEVGEGIARGAVLDGDAFGHAGAA